MTNRSSGTSDRRIFIIADPELAHHPVERFQCVPLIHPKHGKPCRYLILDDAILEIQRVHDTEQLTSAFIDQHVQEDGCVYLATRIDPLFLALPLLDQARKKTADHPGYFLTYSTLFSSPSHFPAHLFTSTSLSLHSICDTQPGWDEPVYRLNDSLLLTHLRSKLTTLLTLLPTLPSFTSLPPTHLLPTALSLLSEYVRDEQLMPLLTECGVGVEDLRMRVKEVREEVVGGDAATERVGEGGGGGVKKEDKKKGGGAAKKLAKISTKGMTSLASMWSKKKE